MKHKRLYFLLSILAAIGLFAGIRRSYPSLYHKLMPTKSYAQGQARAKAAAQRVTPQLTKDLAAKKLTFGAPIFIRSFKEEKELEVWVQQSGKTSFTHFRTYKIAGASGQLGPKLAEGDYQVPEGFYFIKKNQLNPRSRFHLAYNIGYPNTYDRAHKRTGSAIMVHGSTASIGCLAMTDEKIEEIYTLCDAALKNGQSFFRHHSFPFRMTSRRMEESKDHPWFSFWKNLKQGYDAFESTRVPPNATVRNKHYLFN